MLINIRAGYAKQRLIRDKRIGMESTGLVTV
jgi:hypothetical protein